LKRYNPIGTNIEKSEEVNDMNDFAKFESLLMAQKIDVILA